MGGIFCMPIYNVFIVLIHQEQEVHALHVIPL